MQFFFKWGKMFVHAPSGHFSIFGGLFVGLDPVVVHDVFISFGSDEILKPFLPRGPVMTIEAFKSFSRGLIIVGAIGRVPHVVDVPVL